MVISEEQLVTWSHQGSITQSSATYHTIKNALKTEVHPDIIKNCEIFLQGSYANDTNIYAESDIDVVIMDRSSFYIDFRKLSDSQRLAHEAFYKDAKHSVADFKEIVREALARKYGKYLLKGDKAITVTADSSRRKTDVIIAFPHRCYHSFHNPENQYYEEGMCFYNKENKLIINYPKQHSENLTSKHQDTSEWFKPTVRIFKNMHKKLIEYNLLAEDVVASYYLENMLYNVPNEFFKDNYQNSIVNAINWLYKTDRRGFICANKQHSLFQNSSSAAWKEIKCKAFLDALIKFWNM